MSAVGENIKKKRLSQNLSQNRLAKNAGIAQATLSAIESNTKSPAVDTVEKLAAALDCSVAELLGEVQDNIFLTQIQRNLLSIFDQLNDSGKSMLIAQAEIIMQQPAMRKKGSIPSAI